MSAQQPTASARITCGAPSPLDTPGGRAETAQLAAKKQADLQAEHDANRAPHERRLRFRVSAGQYLRGEFGVSFWDEEHLL